MHGMKLCFVHLFPDFMNLYGDRGNMIALVMRARWRGFNIEIREISIGDNKKMADADFIFIGGGQDKEQRIIGKDLRQRRSEIQYCAERGIPILSICGGFQLLGKYYRTIEGDELPGIGILDIWTVAGKKRMIGNIAVKSRLNQKSNILVGFENHAGKTFLGKKVSPLGEVIKGYGNNGEDGKEGAVYKNVIGTYLHGPLLPKNPWLTDYILEKAVNVKYKGIQLAALDNKFEKKAYNKVLKRLGINIMEEI